MDHDGATATRRRRPVFGPEPTIGTSEAFKQVAEDASALVKAEINLAKAEVMEGVKAKATGAGMFAAAGVMGLVGAVFLLVTAFFLLSEVAGLPGWASALILAGVFLLIAGILALVGRKTIASKDISVETTKRNVEEDIAWTKQRLTSR
jgi:VIT1/CCC1 family predicted Fe2+/Mn2+ transporter